MATRSAAQQAALKKAQEASARKRRNKTQAKSQHLGPSRERNMKLRKAIREDFEGEGARGRFKERKWKGAVGSLAWYRQESKGMGYPTNRAAVNLGKQARLEAGSRKAQRRRSIAANKRKK